MEQASEPVTSTPKILVVDDNRDYSRIVALQLRTAGHACVEAFAHSEAIKRLEQDDDIDVVLLDYIMHRQGPEALLHQLRQWPRKLRIIGTSSSNRRPEFAALGIVEFVRKPLTQGHVIQLFDRAGGSPATTTARVSGSRDE